VKLLIRGFRRHADGSWECVATSTLDGPNGRIQVGEGRRFWPGVRYMGIDVVKWLEDEAERQGRLKRGA
jgi:hypothetical protein